MPATKAKARDEWDELDEADAPQPYKKKDRCILGEAIENHPRGSVIAKVAAINSGYSADNVSKQLKQRGVPISSSTVRSHRRGHCACFGAGQ